MTIRLVCFLAICSAILLANANEWKKSTARDRMVCALMLVPALYLGFLYVTQLSGPNLNDIVHAIFAEPAKRIVESVKLPS
ncbi:hypothetical protein [Paenibacillus silvisoli]|uniref:hypothetical protein n=1 Tax=Paenibacillus silvisoli TaxID=3110539 RepID=UPI0028054EE7|nr:hypothetical protein [Paenibacillus silvisoli]